MTQDRGIDDARAPTAAPHGARGRAGPGGPARWAEFTALFVLLPAGVMLSGNQNLLFPLLWGGMAVCIGLLLMDRTFDRSELLGARRALLELPRILLTFAIGAAMLLGLTVVLHAQPQLVWPGLDGPALAANAERITPFGFPRRSPTIAIGGYDVPLYLMIMAAYPIASVYPQEIIFRTFLLHRYRGLFGRRRALIIVCGLAFAWGHIIFRNWVAVALCLPAGVLFAWTYLRTRSTLAASLEHALFGDWIWTVGLGWLFFTGSVGAGLEAA